MRRISRGRVSRGRLVLALGAASAAVVAACSSEAPERTGQGEAALSHPLAPARRVLGDIDGDGRADVALTGGLIPSSSAPWTTIPVAFSAGDGTFRVTNSVVPDFPTYATQKGASAVLGDFDGDGVADLALTGGWIPETYLPWTTIPVAFSKRDGTFRVTNAVVPDFPTYATQTKLRPVVGDFDGDGRADIALSGGEGWTTLPVAFSRGDGTFRITNAPIAGFAAFATQGNGTGTTQLVAADFDGDGRTDLALTAGVIPGTSSPWTTMPVAFSNGDGTFRVTNMPVADFPTFATQSGALAVAGDFDGDGRGDVALTGGKGWTSVPVAFSNGDGTFRVTNTSAGSFATYATQGAQVVAGDLDGDGRADLALTGGGIPGACAPWTTMPVAFSNGDGSFRVTNDPIASFGEYAVQSGPFAVSASQARPQVRKLICTLAVTGEVPCPSCCRYK